MAVIYRSKLMIAVALLAAACTTKKTEPPQETGPSEFATSLSLSASPDVLSQDGSSTSVISVLARNANGQAMANVSLRAAISVNGTITDFGQLSAKNVATGTDGRANIVYTAPPKVDSVDRNTTVTIQVTPLSGDARGDLARSVDIRLVPPGVVGGGLTKVPDFIISPDAPAQLETVVFDASDATLDSTLVAYSWNFGDGSKATGRSTSHQFRDAGTFAVTLTVTDTGGSTGSLTKSVTVAATDDPVASFVFSPGSPGPGEEIVFNGSASTATAPRRIVSYEWQFGTDRSGTGMIVTKKYDTPGTYNVTLTVTDDAGNKGTASQAVTVGTDSPGGLAAAFTFSPTSPASGSAVSFNASTSTSADPIASYKWDFGDGTAPVTKTTATVSHTYGVAGEYTVTLTVTDSKGRKATTSQKVTVS
jgi:PKD repeat protein